MGELVYELNRLAGTTGLEAAKAANTIAGTTGLEVVGALNVKAGTTGLELNGVCRRLALAYGGSAELDAQGALASISAFDVNNILLESGDNILLESGDFLLME